MAQLRIFLSHSSSDRDVADALAHALRGAGADVWYDETHLGTGQLLDEISEQLPTRPVFVVLLSKAAFASSWVKQECKWAYNLFRREPNRIMLPVVAQLLDPSDWNAMLWLEDFRRIEAPGEKPYPQREMVEHTLRLLSLTRAGAAPTPTAPQPSESVDDLITRGKALQQQGKHADALALFERATQLNPNSQSAWFNVGYSLNKLGRYERALTVWDRAIDLNRNDAAAWVGKGAALAGLQQFSEALDNFEQALALDPKYALAWHNKGAVLQNKLRRPQESLEAFEQALTFDPKLKEAWLGKGSAFGSLKRYEEEIAAYRQSLAIDPNYALALKYMAMTLRLLNRTREAEQAEARAKALGG